MATKLPLPGGDLELHSSGDLSKDPEVRLIYNRGRFSQDYAARQGWSTDFSKLSFEQIIEIRSQPEWKHAAFLPYVVPPVEARKPPTFAEVAEHYDPPTGDDLTAIANLWGIQRDVDGHERTDSELTDLLTIVPALWRSETTTRGGLEAMLRRMVSGITRVKVADEPDNDGRFHVLYQGEATPQDVRESLRRFAPVTFDYTIERLEGEWPE